jgi:hypothetical protein
MGLKREKHSIKATKNPDGPIVLQPEWKKQGDFEQIRGVKSWVWDEEPGEDCRQKWDCF